MKKNTITLEAAPLLTRMFAQVVSPSTMCLPRQCWAEAGDGARELLSWTANPGAQKHFDPEHPLAGDSKGSSLALVLYFLV